MEKFFDWHSACPDRSEWWHFVELPGCWLSWTGTSTILCHNLQRDICCQWANRCQVSDWQRNKQHYSESWRFEFRFVIAKRPFAEDNDTGVDWGHIQLVEIGTTKMKENGNTGLVDWGVAPPWTATRPYSCFEDPLETWSTFPNKYLKLPLNSRDSNWGMSWREFIVIRELLSREIM